MIWYFVLSMFVSIIIGVIFFLRVFAATQDSRKAKRTLLFTLTLLLINVLTLVYLNEKLQMHLWE